MVRLGSFIPTHRYYYPYLLSSRCRKVALAVHLVGDGAGNVLPTQACHVPNRRLKTDEQKNPSVW
jgi:hypothetical protein